jgi:transcriptional regulator of heat shock response
MNVSQYLNANISAKDLFEELLVKEKNRQQLVNSILRTWQVCQQIGIHIENFFSSDEMLFLTMTINNMCTYHPDDNKSLRKMLAIMRIRIIESDKMTEYIRTMVPETY